MLVLQSHLNKMEKIQNIKEEINKLYEERKGMEEEVKACMARLQELGVGLEENLVDSEACIA